MIFGSQPDCFAIALTYESNTYNTTITRSQLSEIMVKGEKARRFVAAVKAGLRNGFWIGIGSVAAVELLSWINSL